MTQHSLIDPTKTYSADCQFCGNSHNTDDLTYIEETDKSVCKDCLSSEKIKQCPVCLNEMIYYDHEMCDFCEQADIEDRAEIYEMDKDLRISNMILLTLLFIAIAGFIILKIIL